MLARTAGRLDPPRLDRAFEATHTTSPAGAIMASIDAARALLARDGEELCARLLRVVAAARDRLREVPGLDVLDGPGVEPAKLVVLLAGTGAHGIAVEADLIAAGMPVEMADRDTIIPIVTLADDEAAREPLHRRPSRASSKRTGARRGGRFRPHRGRSFRRWQCRRGTHSSAATKPSPPPRPSAG